MIEPHRHHIDRRFAAVVASHSHIDTIVDTIVDTVVGTVIDTITPSSHIVDAVKQCWCNTTVITTYPYRRRPCHQRRNCHRNVSSSDM